MTSMRYYVAILICLLCFIPDFTSCLGGLSADAYGNVLIEQIESQPDRRIFEPSSPHELSNVIVDTELNRVYVGGVNFLYALDADDVTIKLGEINWEPDPLQYQTCVNFKGDSIRCRNVIRILHSYNDTHIYACGTMAFSPACVYINKRSFKKPEGRPERGKGKSPEDPMAPAISTMSGPSLFAATTPLSPGKNGVICKTVGDRSMPIKTNDDDDFWLSDPQFVSTFTVPEENGQEKVIFLLKENAEEIPLEILTQDNDHSLNVVYSRLVSICANDLGGNPWVLRGKFATFTKMRIACPVEITRGKSKTIPFFYDEIQSSFVIPNPREPHNPTIYATFSTPRGAFEATATCVFEMDDIRQYLSTNKHWNRPGKSRELYSEYEGGEEDSPGACVRDTTQLPIDRLTYGNAHPIKYGIIKPKEGYAVYQDVGMMYSHILVDRITRKEKFGEEVIDKEYDVVHYITDQGYIKRIVFATDDRRISWEIPSRTVYKENETEHEILTVKINNGYLYFGTTASLIQLTVASCTMYTDCGQCSLANDPYCTWNEENDLCEETDFDVPVRAPVTLRRRLNETNCDSNESSMNKKSNDVEELRDKDYLSAEELQLENDRLTTLTKQQNETISNLQLSNDFLTSNLEESMKELTKLMKNYTQLSALLLQYDTRRKLVVRLYRNTVVTLHACQHERSIRKAADRQPVPPEKRNASLEGLECPTKTMEQDECECENERQTNPRLQGRTLTRNPPTLRTLESCRAANLKMNEELRTLRSVQRNLTKEREEIRKTMDSLKNDNQRLQSSLAHAERKNDCGVSQWQRYAPRNKMFLVTREAATYLKTLRYCEAHGGKIVQLNTDDEIRFLHNLTQIIAPKKRYWIGLQKYGDGSLKWADGSQYDSDLTRRFSKKQNGRLHNNELYCIETTSREGQWQLLPCHKPRRVMCMKELNGEVR